MDIVILLVAFLTLLISAFVLSMVFHAFLRVPYVPVPQKVATAMAECAGLREGEVVCDLGAGDGRILLAAKRLCPGIEAIGCEISPSVWLAARLKLWLSGEKIALSLGDARKFQVSDADCVFLYLSPSLMEQLSQKFERELRPGTRIVSYVFRLPGREPVETVKVRVGRKEKAVLKYVW